MRNILFITIMFITVSTGCKSKEQDPFPSVRLPDGTKKTTNRKSLILTVKADSKIYSGDRELPTETLDSLLKIELARFRENEFDTVTVVIDADSAATYGVIFNIMRAAKKNGAKVVARVD